MQPIQGLHHITAVAGDPQANVDFYRNILGQRMIKTTINFDDPTTYHFYFADAVGTPGTVMTFFPWRNMPKGVRGTGETGAVAYSVPPGSLDFWEAHLQSKGITTRRLEPRFRAEIIAFEDPDGMQIELIEDARPLHVRYWAEGPIPEAYALLGFHGVTLWLDEIEPTANLLTEQMGYQFVGNEGMRFRYQGASDDIGLYVDLLYQPGMQPAQFGSGSVHHIAFRTVDDEEQAEYRTRLLAAGQNVTTVQDRQYFRSIYFRSPGGVLFEVATDAPGFLVDESFEELGDQLRLPPWYEAKRAEIEQGLPPFERRPFEKVDVAALIAEGANGQ